MPPSVGIPLDPLALAMDIPSEWSKIEACLENSLAMSKAGSRQSRGIPPTGGIEPLDSIE